MKKEAVTFITISILVLSAFIFPYLRNEQGLKAGVENFYRVEGEILTGTQAFRELNLISPIFNIEKGEIVEVLRDRNREVYLIGYKDKSGWIKAEDIKIKPDTTPDKTTLSDSQIEGYINKSGFNSDTPHLIWVDLNRQRVYILKNSSGLFKLEKTFVCSSGSNFSPTPKGSYIIKDRGLWFYSERFKSGAKNWVRFDGSYLFHSIPMDKEKNILDPTLGQRCSNGCIRLSVEDSKWFFDNIEENSTLWIY